MNQLKSGSVSWQSPSNIALIKYWGKHGKQLPNNPSLSITLSKSVTRTKVDFQLTDSAGPEIDFYFDGKPAREFGKRIQQVLQEQSSHTPFLSRLKLVIHSSNTFPHSSGIASSASAFSALALCVLSIEEQITKVKVEESHFIREASALARMGSGSACRSVYGGFAIWGAMPGYSQYSDEFAVPLAVPLHSYFENYQDSILIVSDEKKKVGSSAGHALMDDNPFAQVRYRQAFENCYSLHEVLQSGNIDRFIRIVENEALTLHALMMASNPGYLLMSSGTIEIINRIRNYRNTKGIPVCFTLDAGPNVHLLFPAEFKNEVNQFITNELLLFCRNKQWIDDETGTGPVKLI